MKTLRNTQGRGPRETHSLESSVWIPTGHVYRSSHSYGPLCHKCKSSGTQDVTGHWGEEGDVIGLPLPPLPVQTLSHASAQTP